MTEQTPLDRFKQALTGTARALAREEEVEVAWSADSPSQAGKNFRVPLPGRTLPGRAPLGCRLMGRRPLGRGLRSRELARRLTGRRLPSGCASL